MPRLLCHDIVWRNFPGSRRQPQFAAELPRHRSTLDDACDLAAEPVFDHRAPRHQRKFVGVLDQRELAARELDGLLEDAPHRLAIAGRPKWQRPRGSEYGAGADDVSMFKCGDQVAAIENPAVAMTDSVALSDQMLAASIHGLLHVPPEAGRDQIGGTAPYQPAIEPGRALSLDLTFKIEGRKHANVELPISHRIISRGPALKILRKTPMVGVDPLDDPSSAQRLEPANVSLDKAVMVAAGNAAHGPGQPAPDGGSADRHPPPPRLQWRDRPDGGLLRPIRSRRCYR